MLYKAKKETTYGSRLVSQGDYVHAPDNVTLDPEVWEALPQGESGANIVPQDFPPVPMGMNTDPRSLMDMTRLQEENAALRAQLASLQDLQAEHATLQQQLAATQAELGSEQSSRAELDTKLAQLQQEHSDKATEYRELMQNMKDEIDRLKTQLKEAGKKRS